MPWNMRRSDRSEPESQAGPRGRLPVWWRRQTVLGLSVQLGATLGIAVVGLVVARQLRLPGGPFVGAMLLTSAVQLWSDALCEPPKWLCSAGRILLGLTIGATVTAETVTVVVQTFVPVVIIILSMIVLGVGVAWVIARRTKMGVSTALCGTTPGVMAAMVAMADDLGGDGRLVASMHLIRLVSILIFVPPLVHRYIPPVNGDHALVATTIAGGGETWRLAALVIIGLAVGLAAARRKVPAGELMGGLLVAAVLNPAWLHLGRLPDWWRLVSQCIVGAGVGAMVTKETLRDFRPFVVAGAVMTAVLIVSGMGLGLLLWQVTELDLVTCIVGASPGGADQMVILAGELGGNEQLVAAMHVTRQVILMLLVPVLSKVAARNGRASAPAQPPTATRA